MDEKLNRKMDEQLASRVAELDAHNDETGDGKLDAADLKAQLNRIEAQLELQDEQNRSIMKNQRLRMLLTIIITVVLLVVLGLFWNHMDQAYKEVMTACTQVNELADTLQSSLDTLDPDFRAKYYGDNQALPDGDPHVLYVGEVLAAYEV